MAKKTPKSSSGGFKQLLLQKGERIGFIAAATLLVLFLGFGVYVASTSASSTTITKDIATNIQTAKQKMLQPGGDPPDVDPTVFVNPSPLTIKFTEYPTPYPFFNEAEEANPKRMSPKVLPATEASVQFVSGAARAFEIVADASGKTLIGVLVNKEVTQNDSRRVKELQRRQKGGKAAGANKAGTPPVPPPGGGPPGTPFGGSRGGSSRGGMDMPSGGPGGMTGQTKTTELQINYVELDSKELEAGRVVPAQALMPVRLVVITGTVPYRKQVEEFVRALRATSDYELGVDLPIYKGLVVERQVLSPDGQVVREDWAPLDVKAAFGDVFARAMEFEPNVLTPEQYRDLTPEVGQYFNWLLPDWYHRLLAPRPVLLSGKYDPIDLPTAIQAMKELEKSAPKGPPLKNPAKDKLSGGGDPYGDPSALGQAMPGMGGDRGSDAASPGGGRGGFMPPPGVPPGGGDRGPGGLGGRGGPFGGGVGNDNLRGGPGVPEAGIAVVPPDAWLFRFIDATTQPGNAYRYKIKFKMENPNYKRDPKLLAIPKLAEKEELESEFFLVKDLVQSPPDQHLYAAADEPRANPPRVTQKLPAISGQAVDETWVQVHKWLKDVRPKGTTRAEPLGDWLIADIHAVRGQYLGETPKVELPVWSMREARFVFRENPPPRNAPGVRRTAKDLRSWEVDIVPTPDTLVVDFAGGNGEHLASSKGRRVTDNASMDILLMTEDGKVRLLRSTNDLADEDRKKRLETWETWLRTVQEATATLNQSGNNPFGNSGGRGDQ